MEKPFLVIIDEESDNLELLQYNFIRRGMYVRTFSNPERALTFLRGKKPDMIVCDGLIAGDRGKALCLHIRKDPFLMLIPLVITSYQAEKSAIRNALESGATDYIIKPIKAYDLVTRIEQLMAHSPEREEV